MKITGKRVDNRTVTIKITGAQAETLEELVRDGITMLESISQDSVYLTEKARWGKRFRKRLNKALDRLKCEGCGFSDCRC